MFENDMDATTVCFPGSHWKGHARPLEIPLDLHSQLATGGYLK